MNKLIATASGLALLASAGIGHAQTAANPTQPPANLPSSATGGPISAPLNLAPEQIRQVQQQLQSAGLYNGTIDGMMGPETKQALQQFQQQNGLQQTGALDQQTMAALNNNSTSRSGSGMAPSANSPSNSAVGPSVLHGSTNPSAAPTTTTKRY